MNKISILLIDEKPITMRCLSLLIGEQEDMEVVGEVERYQDLSRKIEESLPNIVLVDLDSSYPAVFETIRAVTESHSELAFLALSERTNSRKVHQVFRSGFRGFITRDTVAEDLYSAIRLVHSGEVYIHPQALKTLVGLYFNKSSGGTHGDNLYERLSAREREVLPYLAEGRSNSSIGIQMKLSQHTVQTYRQRVMRKLELHSKIELIKYGFRRGLVRLYD